MEQFVFFCVKDSVAAVKRESSILGDVDSVEFSPSAPGEGGGVGYALPGDFADEAFQVERKLSRPLVLGTRNW